MKCIFGEHEYEIPQQFLPSNDNTIVDIGANVGLFALYMKLTKSVNAIHCFEPAPASIKLLQLNMENMAGIHIHPFGLANQNGTVALMLHPQNTGQNSLVISGGSRDSIDVPVQDAGAALNQIGLNYIDVLKNDTEGCEVPILESLTPRLDYIGILMLEYHSEKDRRSIDQLLSRFKLFGSKAVMTDVGTLKYINKRLLGE